MTLLFITQKLHSQDAFGVLWIREFIRRGYDVTALCLEDLGQKFEFPVYSLGKERGQSKLRQVLCFWKLIMTLKYDRVFIHMSPIWYVLGWKWWLIRRIPVYMWYTHYKMQLGVRLFRLFGKRFFCATWQSLPQYHQSEKKIVVGHGIDLSFWPMRRNECTNHFRLLMVHRLSQSKRVELSIRAFEFLPKDYTLDIYGIEAEPDYVAQLRALVATLKVGHRIHFHGTVPMGDLPSIYVQHHLILNLASETIDKTMLEAMTCGCYPVTTRANAYAIGLPIGVAADTPEAISMFVQVHSLRAPMKAEEMYRTVLERHSLSGLITKMDQYIRSGL